MQWTPRNAAVFHAARFRLWCRRWAASPVVCTPGYVQASRGQWLAGPFRGLQSPKSHAFDESTRSLGIGTPYVPFIPKFRHSDSSATVAEPATAV